MRSRSISRGVVAALGGLALVPGVLGVLSPELQAQAMGMGTGSAPSAGNYTSVLLVVVSLSAVNTGLLYLYAAYRRWPGFAGLAVVARTVMGAGLAGLLAFGGGPQAFLGAAVWEWLGAGLIAATAAWDRSRAEEAS